MRALLTSLVLAAASPLAAQDAPEWRPVDSGTGQIRDLDGLSQLAVDFPDSGTVRLRLVQAQLAAGDIEAALESLAWLKERGYVFSEGARARIPEMIGEEHAEVARALLIPEAEVIEASEVVAEVPADAGLVESVFNPDGDDVFVVTSITPGGLHIRTPDGEWMTVNPSGASDLSGLVSSADDREGWVASSNLDGSQDDPPKFNGLMRLGNDLENPDRVPAPEGVSVSDLAIAGDGTVYASDPTGGGIYVKAPGSTELQVLVAPGNVRSPQGLAVSDDGTRLYFSDYRYGLGFVDLMSGEVSRLQSDVPVILDGTDGLWLHRGELVAVQNGTSPMRISAFTLSEDGTRVVATRLLEQAHGEWTEPLSGNISDDALVYVGTGQWDRYFEGELREGMEAIPTQIRRLPLYPSAN